MPRSVLLVDLENVQKVDLSRVPPEAHVMIFYGITQKKLPEELVVQAQPLGARLTWIKISGQGPNALDFHIAYYLGREFALHRDARCAILSRDLGFDPLVRHLQTQHLECRRVATLKDAFPAELTRATVAEPFDRLLKLLAKERQRPLKRKSLEGKVKGWFQTLSAPEQTALLQRLINEGHVRESGKTLVYDF
jgi:hypothetical protein